MPSFAETPNPKIERSIDILIVYNKLQKDDSIRRPLQRRLALVGLCSILFSLLNDAIDAFFLAIGPVVACSNRSFRPVKQMNRKLSDCQFRCYPKQF